MSPLQYLAKSVHIVTGEFGGGGSDVLKADRQKAAKAMKRPLVLNSNLQSTALSRHTSVISRHTRVISRHTRVSAIFKKRVMGT